MYVQVGHKKNSSSHSTVIYPSGGAQKDWICDKHFFIPSSPGGNKHAHIKYMTAYSIPAWPAGHLGLHVAYVHFLSSSPYNGQILQKKTHLLICYVKICSSVFFLCFFASFCQEALEILEDRGVSTLISCDIYCFWKGRVVTTSTICRTLNRRRHGRVKNAELHPTRPGSHGWEPR